MRLSLIFPAYNEATAVIGVLASFSDYCRSRNIDHEIIVVNDGSRDATRENVLVCAKRHPSIRLIEHRANRGYGAAVRTGLSAATGDFLFFTDSDGRFGPEDLERTLSLRDDRAIVLGYRHRRADGFVRRVNAWLWGRCVGVALGFRVRDLGCAWKLFPRSLLSDMTLDSRGAFINAELLHHARKKGLAFREVPVRHRPRRSGAPTGGRVRHRTQRRRLLHLERRTNDALHAGSKFCKKPALYGDTRGVGARHERLHAR